MDFAMENNFVSNLIEFKMEFDNEPHPCQKQIIKSIWKSATYLTRNHIYLRYLETDNFISKFSTKKKLKIKNWDVLWNGKTISIKKGRKKSKIK